MVIKLIITYNPLQVDRQPSTIHAQYHPSILSPYFYHLNKQIINYRYIFYIRKEMNIINTGVQLGISYPLNPTLFLNTQPLLYSTHILTPQIPSEREINLETSFKILQEKYQALLQENQELKNRLQECEKQPQNKPNKRSFIRRTEDELDKKFKCCYDNCKKEYASTLALNLHIKNKHRGTTVKQMSQQAKKIIEAELKGKQAPIDNFNLPEGYLQQFRRQHMAAPSTASDLQSLQQ